MICTNHYNYDDCVAIIMMNGDSDGYDDEDEDEDVVGDGRQCYCALHCVDKQMSQI